MFKRIQQILCLVVILSLFIPQLFAAPPSYIADSIWRITVLRSSVFDGATTNAHGSLGEKPTYTVFTVTGDIIIIAFWGVVNTTLTDVGDAGRVEVGVVGNTAILIPQIAGATAGATLLADGDIWLYSQAAASQPAGAVRTSAAADSLDWYINDGANIVETTSGADITGGQIDYYIIWVPVESGASVVEAGTLS